MTRVLKPLLLLAILGAGVAAFFFLTSTRDKPERHRAARPAPTVEVSSITPTTTQARVSAMGAVIPARQVTVLPEVSGRLVFVSPDLVPGGSVRRGQVLARIDPRDYDLAIAQLNAQVAQAELALAQEKGRQAVAVAEWKQIEAEIQPTAEGRKLALRETQVLSAETAVASARSTLEQAELRRERTTITAPFAALVVQESVDVGQVVGPSSQIATLVDRDEFWVRVAVPIERLAWVRIPGVDGATTGSPVRISQRSGGAEVVERVGRVVKLLGDLDARGSLARVLVAVEEPLAGPGLPLLLGAQVAALIEGPELDDVVRLPAAALVDGARVWTVDREQRLAAKQVEVLWRDRDGVMVRGALGPADRVVIRGLATPVEGQTVRVTGEPARQAPAAERVSDTPHPGQSPAGGPS